MWLSPKIFGILEVAKDSVDEVKRELAAVKAERDALKTNLSVLTIQSDWLRMQVNTLQIERTALMERAYGIRVPAPEIIRKSKQPTAEEFSFDDIGDEAAKALGMPLYDLPFRSSPDLE